MMRRVWPLEVSVSAMAAFSDGSVFRSYDHLLAAGAGTLLCVPMGLAAGDLRSVVDGCPVPWEEVFSVIDSGCATPLELPPNLVEHQYPALASLAREGWSMDLIALGAGRLRHARLIHVSGIRFAHLIAKKR